MYLKINSFHGFLFIFLFFFIFIKSEEKVTVSFEKVFPESILENFYKIIAHKLNFLKNYDQKSDTESFLDKTLDSIIDIHSHIFLLKRQINERNFFFKEDLTNLIFFINKINEIFEKTILENSLKKQTINLLVNKAILKLNALIRN